MRNRNHNIWSLRFIKINKYHKQHLAGIVACSSRNRSRGRNTVGDLFYWHCTRSQCKATMYYSFWFSLLKNRSFRSNQILQKKSPILHYLFYFMIDLIVLNNYLTSFIFDLSCIILELIFYLFLLEWTDCRTKW